MISGIFGEYSPRISKNGDGEGDPLCLSFGDTSKTGIIQNLGWLQGNLWKSPKIPCCCCLLLSTRHIYWLQGSRRSKSLEGPLVMDFKNIGGPVLNFGYLLAPPGRQKRITQREWPKCCVTWRDADGTTDRREIWNNYVDINFILRTIHPNLLQKLGVWHSIVGCWCYVDLSLDKRVL